MGSVGTTGIELLSTNPKRRAIHLENTHATQTLYLSYIDGPGNILSTSPNVIKILAGNNFDVNLTNQGESIKRGWAIVGSGAGTTYNLSEFADP